VKGDGGLGYAEMAPYDRICITAACIEIPPPLIEQLRIGGRLIAPVIEMGSQNLVLIEKSEKGISRKVICTITISCCKYPLLAITQVHYYL